MNDPNKESYLISINLLNTDLTNKYIQLGFLQDNLNQANETIKSLIKENQELNSTILELQKGEANGESDKPYPGEFKGKNSQD